MPSRFIADFLVESEIVLTKQSDMLNFVHPNGSYEIQISNAKRGEKPGVNLSMQVILECSSLDEAEDIAIAILRKFLHLLSLVTSFRFGIYRPVLLMDWTPGLRQRQAYIYSSEHTELPIEALSKSLLSTVANLQKQGTGALSETALRWFANGVASTIMEDQFQFFWFVVEIIAIGTKTSNKVVDKCQFCGGSLSCSECGKVSEHKPFEKQRVRALLERMQFGEEVIDFFFKIRNALLHGEEREAIEARLSAAQPKFSFHKAVDLIAKAAMLAIMQTFIGEKESFQPGEMLYPNTYVSWKLTGKAHIVVPVSGDIDNPRIEDVVVPELSVFTEANESEKPKP